MLKIIHRVNDPAQLRNIPSEFGVEVDLHAYGDQLVVHHDAFQDGPDFDDWLDAFDHAFAIFNIKEEGIERMVRERVAAHGIVNYFFLDLSFPALIKLVRAGESRIALRVSEYEPVVGAFTLAGQVSWIWLDVFHGLPIDGEECQALHAAGFKICAVSPELHGRNKNEIAVMKRHMLDVGCVVDAVCTKQPELW
jgi:hypothetical protein